MLIAINSNKAGRMHLGSAESSVRWRDVFRESEDLLTAVFFGRFSYLSDMAIRSMMGILVGEEGANRLGAFKGVEFWPHLVGLKDRVWVEPDVLLHFESAVVIVEVKPPFGTGEQRLEQWQAEINAFLAECREERDPPKYVYFLALGRNVKTSNQKQIPGFDGQDCFELFVQTCEWDELTRKLSRLETSDFSRSDHAVMHDLTLAFGLFGLDVEPKKCWQELVGFQRAIPDLDFSTLEKIRTFEKTMMKSFNCSSGSRQKVLEWADLVNYSQLHTVEFGKWTKK